MTRRSFPRRRYIAAALAAIVAVCVVAGYAALRDERPFSNVEGQFLDWRFVARGPHVPSGKVVLVIVDDESIEALKGWPISRKWIADAISRISRDGARAIAIDLVLTPTGRKIDPRGDDALLQAMNRNKRVVLPLAFQYREDGSTTPPQAVSAHAFKSVVAPPGGASPLPVQPVGVLAPSEAYLSVGRAGHVNFFVAADGTVRRIHLALPFGRNHYPALPLELVRLLGDVPAAEMTAVLGDGIRVGDRFIETDELMRLGVNYLGPTSIIPRVSLIDLLEGRVRKGYFEGRAVLVGVQASGVGDAFDTPFERRFAGVALLATVTENLLENSWLRHGPASSAIDLVVMVVIGLLVAALLASGLAGPALLTIAGAAVVVPIAAQVLFERSYLWLNLTFPLIELTLLALLSGLFLLFGEHRARRRAEARSDALGRFVSPLVQRHLEQGVAGRRPEAADVRTALVIAMFVDIRGFTRLSQDLSPAEVAAWMRRFHGHVEDTVARFDGVIDKYIGDGVLALFGVGGATPADAGRAIACAEALAGRSGPLPTGADYVRLAVGLHMGPVAIEVMGGSARAEVSVAGDTVNVASRLQSLTRELHVDVVASEAVIDAGRAVSDREFWRWRECAPQALRGREGSIAVRTWTAEQGTAEEGT